MESLLRENDLAALRQAVHQLKGAGGGYGFPQITERAAQAEEQIKAQAPDLATIQSGVQSLIELVRNVDGYDRAREQVPAAS
jgi:HPt (histidine-containing phosphotransfer) domain-containing protein